MLKKAPTQENDLTGKVPDSQDIRTEDEQSEELQNQIEEIASPAKGRVRVVAVVLENRENRVVDPFVTHQNKIIEQSGGE
jgi:hypothetical protein